MSEPSSRVEPNGLCRCGHTGKAHPYQGRECPCVNHGCECRAFVKVSLPTVINDRCRCSHDRFRHNYDTADGPCSKPDCECKAYAPVTVETVELPEPEACTCASAGDAFAPAGHYADCPEAPPEPPAASVRDAVQRLADRLPPPEGPEYTPCACGHIEPDHSAFGAPHCLKCECPLYRTEPPCKSCGQTDGYWFDRSVCAEPCGSMHDRCTNCGAVSGHCPLEGPPQPERRPPLTVQYSVAGGHPYEVSIPGDASVTAEDGVLIVKHPSAQILAITRVAPMEG